MWGFSIKLFSTYFSLATHFSILQFEIVYQVLSFSNIKTI